MFKLKNKLVSHALVPLAVLTLYFVSFYYFLSYLLPESSVNVNRRFVGEAWKYSFLLLLLSILLYLIVFIIFEISNEKRKDSKSGNAKKFTGAKKFFIEDLLLLLLPLTPIAQYVLNNQNILSFLGSLYVLTIFAVFFAIFIILIPILLGFISSTKILMHLGLAFSFTIASMAFLSAEFHWYKSGSLNIQLLFFAQCFL